MLIAASIISFRPKGHRELRNSPEGQRQPRLLVIFFSVNLNLVSQLQLLTVSKLINIHHHMETDCPQKYKNMIEY